MWCRLLGTPTEKQWAGVTTLRDWHVYPVWEPQNLARAVPALGPDGVDLLSVSIFEAALRINFSCHLLVCVTDLFEADM